ncbi:glycosyltransferase family 2 protein [Rothia sp. P5764]|uniref:glycosyltransferase family 2 protein n=1 Tax=Rothia sp. P5764 TaxID=3402654 RepID=UPI003ACF3F14
MVEIGKNPVLLSVIIPFYGDPADSITLIEQIKNQSNVAPLEVIVSDDFSPTPFPQVDGVTVVRRETNGGFGSNVNSGVAQAKGDWILILNSDLTLPPHFLGDMVAAYQHENGAIISPQVLGHGNQSQWVGRRFPKTAHHAWEWFTPVARFRDTRFWHIMVGHDTKCQTGKRAEPDWLMGACMMLRKADFEAVGGMDERFFMNSEEIDLQRRLADQGIKRVFRGDIVVRHAGGGSSGGSAQRRQWVLNSRFIYNKKWDEGLLLAPILKAVSYLNFVFNTFRSLWNSAVKPRRILQEELKFIKKAEAQ